MANVLFKKGELAGLKNAPIQEGTIYITTDERAMYLDVSATQRIRLGDFIEVADIDSLPTGGANISALYYATKENVLAKWSGSKWVQINPDNWFEIKSFAQTLTSSTAANNVTTITAKTTLVQKNEAGDEAASGSGAYEWNTNLKFKDDGKVVTITKEGDDTIKISAKDEKVTSAANHYKYDKDRDGSKALTPATDTGTGNKFITGVTVDNAGHIVEVKAREAVIDLVSSATLKSTTATPDVAGNTAANINLEVKHGDVTRKDYLKVEGSGATTVTMSGKGKTINISSTDQTVEYGHHYDQVMNLLRIKSLLIVVK